MRVKKRNNRLVNFNPQKLIKRLTQYKSETDLTKYIHRAVISCQNFFYDGITTSEVDARLAQCVSQLAIFEPEMEKLGGYVVISSLEKDIKVRNYDYLSNPVLTEDFIEKYSKYTKPDLDQPNMSYFAAYTLKEEFLLRNEYDEVVETPLDFYWRIALANAKNEVEANDFFIDLIKDGFATSNPISVNSGTTKGKLISCTTMSITGDNKEGILKVMSNAATHSANNSGLGIYIGDVRSKKTRRSRGGKASGLLRLVKMLIPISAFFRQHEKRRGAFALYCDIWHRDILDFIPMKRQDLPHSLTDQDGFYGICIPDLFYKRFENNEDWSLFCPKEVKSIYGWRISDFVGEEFEEKYTLIEREGKVEIDTIPSSDLMLKLVDAMASSGVPYVFNRDHANKNHQQKHLGVLKSQQLCVSGDTLVTTKKGNIPILELEGKEVEAWNGEQWSKTKFFKTGENKDLLEISFSNGESIKCTPNHKFFIKNRNKPLLEVEAKDLVLNDKLQRFNFGSVEGDKTLKNPYTQGFYSGDGYVCNYSKGIKANLRLYDSKKELLDKFSKRNKLCQYSKKETDETFVTINEISDTITVGLSDDINPDKNFVPDETYSIETRLKWLSGLIDADGTCSKNNSIQISSINKEFLLKVKATINLMGVDCKVVKSMKPKVNFKGSDYISKECFRVCITSKDSLKLKDMGLNLHRCAFSDYVPKHSYSHQIKVVNISKLEGKHDTYCGTEPIKHRLMFNNTQASNCNEFAGIHNETYEAQCDLGSIPLPSHIKNGKFDFESLRNSVRKLTRLLNNVIDINVWNTPESQKAGLEHRNIGIGLLGLADVFAILGYTYGSPESRALNAEIQKTIYLAALEESNLIAKETGKGMFDTLVCREPQEWIPDWLKESVAKYGVMNQLLTCNMPTSTTSKLKDVNKSFEVFDFPVSVRETVLGEFKQINKYLVKDLKELGFWNEEVALQLVDRGDVSILSSFVPKDILDKYIDKYRHSNKVYLEMAADRQKYLDQGQSMNLYYEKPERTKLSTALYYGWKLGLQSGSYYTTFMKKKNKDNLTSKGSVESKKQVTNGSFDCFGCD